MNIELGFMLEDECDFYSKTKKMKRLIFQMLLGLLLFSNSLLAQQDSLEFRKISTSDGLSQSSVITIEQDRLGRMWLGTRDGLNLYNGNTFKVFRNNPNDSLSISNSDILSIDEDQKGFIWVGTYYGLNRYNPQKNTFQRFVHHNSNSIAGNTVWSVKVLKNGEVWIGTSEGISIYHPQTQTFSQLNINDLFEGISVQSITEATNATVWLGTSVGLFKVEKKTEEKFDIQHFGEGLFVQDVIEGENGKLWLGTKSRGLYTFEVAIGKLQAFQHKEADKINKNVRSLDFDNEGTLWVGTYNGVNLVYPDGKITKVTSNPYQQKSLSKNTVKSVFVDKKGSVWIGAYYGGVNIWDISNTNFNSYSEKTGKVGLSYDVVSSIESDGENFYFGTEGGGITILNQAEHTTSYLNQETLPDFPSGNIKSLLYVNNQLWVGTFNAGVALYDFKKKTIISTQLTQKINTYLQGTGVYAIEKQTDSILWLGSFGKGLLKLNIQEESLQTFKAQPEKKNALSSNNIRTLLVDKAQKLWVGTDKGLNRLQNLSSENSAIQQYLFNQEEVTGDDVLSIYQDTNEIIWVGTKYNGLFSFQNNSLKKVPVKIAEERITTIHAIVEDKNGHLWLSSNQGIIDFDPQQNTSELYNQKDGLVSNEFNNNAGFRQGSHIYFGGPSGVTFFNPQKITKNAYSPQVILTDFKIQNKSVEVGGEEKILQQNITYTDEVELSYDKSNFSIQYAIPNFISSSNNQYKYRLLGLEKEWNLTSSNEVNYIIQKPGTYTFEVKGANNDGKWNEEATQLKITVHPAPWRSAWAFIIYALLIAGALFGLLRIIKSKSKLQHKLELEKIESENNRKLNKAKLEFFTNISHEFRTPLTLIIGPLQQLLADYKGSNLMYKKLLVIESSANQLLQLINRLMDFRKLENNQTKLEAAEGNIVKFLREIYLSFSEYAENGDYTYTFKTSHESMLVYYDRVQLERVFFNLISNAFRYTPKGGEISVEIEKEENEIKIAIKDSGVGIPEDSLAKIFDRFYEVEKPQPAENYNQGTGIGLSIAKNIVQLHQGKIIAENQSQGGAVFTVILKTGKEHLSEEDLIKDFKFSDDISQYVNQLEKPGKITKKEFDDLVLEEGKHTLLLVEDSEPLRSFMANLLKSEYNIIEAENGKVALEKTLKYMPDLIVSDVIMPEMVGTELCSQIKKNVKTSHIPVILLTSRSALVYKFEGLESGADDYISKPFNVKEFQLRIKNLIDSTQRLKAKFSSENNLVPEDMTVSSLDEKLFKKALDIVRENISNEQFNIPTFSAELGVSRTMLFTKIKAWTNCTPNEFIQEIRMKTAAQLLEKGKINISEVSYKVGFKNPKYFSKCFQKKYGKTPTQYSNTFFEDSQEN